MQLPRTDRRTLLGAAGALALLACLPARAQASRGAFRPTRTVRLVSPLQAGGATDAVIRPIAQKLADLWGQPVVVENKPGGGTILGTQAVVQSAPDGHTFGVVVSSITINPSLRSDLPYDTFKDITPITQIGNITNALVAHPSVPASNVKELIEHAKAHPGQLSWASLGVGTAGHITGELMARRAGMQVTHVPFSGSSGAYRELLPGRVHYGFVVLESALPHIKAGKLKLLALTDPRRNKLHPEMPLLDETLPGLGFASVFGLIGPANLPPGVLTALHADIVKVLQDPEIAAQLERQSMAVDGSTPAEFAAIIRREVEHWKKAVKESGANVN
ncbi:tripartite tricarboxylate transporter substrate binding protein [Ramlibacter sp. AW1]|uniref:Tripartite tricarboxylate transporter substrate binding protein n=1 Tax=Ramlibacter aurantiacus TaxID=2801330 RepID=A0A936ZSB1_9BURK|nr:tripartite tricarboxylate transporter substrate binding protein [Ramlibacter aurantiacus]MBL0421646.1 tripartite tricarboxylate transporter substrate binding protein [Ramlibacter aurantiacus]